MYRNRETVLKMTPTEKKILKLARSGLTHRQIEQALGWNPTKKRKGISRLAATAAEKERLLALDDRRGRQDTSLKRSRGYTTQSGDPI